MVVLSMCSRGRYDAPLDDLYWKPRYLAVFPPPSDAKTCLLADPTASYYTWQNMYLGRWQERRRARRIEGDACAMGLRLGAPLALYAPLDLTDPPAATPWRWPGLSRSVEVMHDDGRDEDYVTTSGPRHGLVTVGGHYTRHPDHYTRQLRYFVEESGSEEGPDRGEIDVSVWLSDAGDIVYIRVHTSDGVLHDPDRPEVGRRRISVGAPVSELLQAYGLGADDVSNLALDRFGPTFGLRGVRGLRFGVAGEIEDGIPEKEELLDERLVSIHVTYAR